MKKTTLLALLGLLCTIYSRATVTFTLVTPPCDTNGVLAIHFSTTTAPSPYHVYWQGGAGGSGSTFHNITMLNDTIFHYSGSACHVTIYDSTFGLVDSGTFAGALPFSFSFNPTPPFCGVSGTASLTIAGGTAPYTYSWYSLPGGATAGTTNPITVPYAIYGVWIKDAAGCLSGSTIQWMPVYGTYYMPYWDSVLPTPVFSVSITTTDANCTNGTATAIVTGGATPPLSYSWSNGASTSSITGLTAGYYGLNVTDALGCIAGVPLGSSTISGYSTMTHVNQSITVTAPITPSSSTCGAADGSLIAFGSGGTPPYSYLWSNGATTQSQSGLLPGPYNVTATDANGCTGMEYGFINTTSPITVTYTTTPSNCTTPTGSATLILAGGTAPYSVYWYTSPVQTTATAVALAPGTYNFKVTDAAGCIKTGTVTVPPIHIISAPFTIATAPYCSLATGSLGVSPSGGTTPYTYLWSTGAATSTISSIPMGTYHVTITDAAGCQVSVSRTLLPFSPVILSTSSTPATCLYTADGMITAVVTGGTPPYTYSPGGSTGVIGGLLTGHYWIGVSDLDGCTDIKHTYVGYDAANTSCYCSIEGTVYHDLNGNCTQETGEPGIENIQMYCSGRGYTYTDAAGHYSFKVPSGTYTISEVIRAFYPLAPCQSNSITLTASAATGCVIPQNFANVINPIHDMHVSSWDYHLPVVGNTYNSISVISNEGTVPEASVLAGYKPDGQLLAPSFVPSGIFTGSPFYYNTASGFPTMAPGTSQAFLRNYLVPTDIPINTEVYFKDSVVYTAPMSDWTLDYSPWNNVTAYTTTVVGSYDPNFKEVHPQGVGPHGIIQYTDSVLEYMVHFQNTGSWYAENITVLDTLDDDLDWNTLRPTYQSSECQVTVTQSGAYKVAKFYFPSINLPPQMWDDLRSNGLFTYTIRPKTGLPVGTQFKNRASIYFDYNAPIRTNQTENTLVSYIPGGVGTLPFVPENSFTVYPNPATNSFHIALNNVEAGTASIFVTDVSGRTVINRSVTLVKGAQTLTTDASQLAAGVYFVSLNHNGKTETQKLVVIK